jgi:uncharacterized protein involved in exopolysaccharide biosynthesis
MDMLGKCRIWWTVVLLIMNTAVLGVLVKWFVAEPLQETSAAIRVSSVIPRIIYSDKDTEQPMPNYEEFKNTEAARITTDIVLNKVADKLKGLNLDFLRGSLDPIIKLRQAVKRSTIRVKPGKRNELIDLKMTSHVPGDAEKIINAFLDSYIEVYYTEMTKSGGQTMTILEDQRQSLLTKMDQQRDAVAKLIEEFGTQELTPLQTSMFRQVERLQDELINANIKRISLETRLQTQDTSVEDTTLSPELQEQKKAFLKDDLILQDLLSEQRKYETLVAESEQSNADASPELKRRKGMLDNLTKRADARRREISDQFDATYKNQAVRNRQRQLAEIKAELDQTIAYEKGIQDKMDGLDTKTINLGRKQFAINDQQEQLDRTKAMYNEVCKRIEEIKVESQRPARIAVAFRASSVPIDCFRLKRFIALGIAEIVLLLCLALNLALIPRRQPAPPLPSAGN